MPFGNFKFGENRLSVKRALFKGLDENLPILLISLFYFYITWTPFVKVKISHFPLCETKVSSHKIFEKQSL